MRTRAFSLIEVVIVVLVLALAVPPTLMFMNEAVSRDTDAVNAMRATTMATSIMETVLADVASTDASLGYVALANAATYLNTPATGLTARLSALLRPYTDLGMSYTVSIGAQVNSAGVMSAVPAENAFRIITVTVTFPSAQRASSSVVLSAMVSDL